MVVKVDCTILEKHCFLSVVRSLYLTVRISISLSPWSNKDFCGQVQLAENSVQSATVGNIGLWFRACNDIL